MRVRHPPLSIAHFFTSLNEISIRGSGSSEICRTRHLHGSACSALWRWMVGHSGWRRSQGARLRRGIRTSPLHAEQLVALQMERRGTLFPLVCLLAGNDHVPQRGPLNCVAAVKSVAQFDRADRPHQLRSITRTFERIDGCRSSHRLSRQVAVLSAVVTCIDQSQRNCTRNDVSTIPGAQNAHRACNVIVDRAERQIQHRRDFLGRVPGTNQ